MSASQDPSRMEHDGRPVVWTPEDASRFLTAAIHESQRPLAEALGQRPITTKGLLIVLAAVVGYAAASIWLFSSRVSSQLEKAEQAAREAGMAKDAVQGEKAELLSRAAVLESRLDSAREDNSRLKTEASGLREGEEELRRARSDNQRFRRQVDLLRSQISGLEMEKTALARQLEALKALALDGHGEVEPMAPASDSSLSHPARAALPLQPTPAAPAPLVLETPISAVTVTREPAAAGAEKKDGGLSLQTLGAVEAGAAAVSAPVRPESPAPAQTESVSSAEPAASALSTASEAAGEVKEAKADAKADDSSPAGEGEKLSGEEAESGRTEASPPGDSVN